MLRAMWPVLLVVSIAVAVWARWLASRPDTPRWVRWIAPAVVATTIGTGLYVLWGFEHTFSAVSDANPSDKAERLASGLSGVYTALLIGWAIAALAIMALTWIAIRRPSRRTDRPRP